MKRPSLTSFDPRPGEPRPLDHQRAMLAALSRAHALQLEQLAEAALTMSEAELDRVDLSVLARELVDLTQQAAVIEAAVRRLAEVRA